MHQDKRYRRIHRPQPEVTAEPEATAEEEGAAEPEQVAEAGNEEKVEEQKVAEE